jgi:dTDP-4-dehydrorhamnose reductase
MNILITGGGGYIAKSLYNALRAHHNVTSVSRKDFDLSNTVDTLKYFSDKYFDVVLHCAVTGGSRLRPDTMQDLDNNLSMYYNLLNCSSSFKKLINFSSGAEISSPESLYGLSKRVITKSITEKPYYNNIKIFAVFDENELNTRFIKANLLKYINHEPMLIHQNKHMDFFYMKDLISLVSYYITTEKQLPDVDCVYMEKYKLTDITRIINECHYYRVSTKMSSQVQEKSYMGTWKELPIKLIGLKQGIQETYNKLKNEY